MRDEDRTPSRVPSAAMDASDPSSILYQHTVLCQTCLPYRNPGDAVREWEREQGATALKVSAGEARDTTTGTWVKLGLPWGPKPRLILAHLNAEALRTGKPLVEVEGSLTAFVERIGLCCDGRTINVVKDQLARLSAAQIRMAIAHGEHARQVQAHIVTGFDLWFPKDERQRVLWPTAIQLSLDYFESLQRHAVPLDECSLAALSHSAMALDIYAWLAQRLHRIDPGRPQFVPWQAIKDQFGHGYGRMVEFRRVFRRTLEGVLGHYRAARLKADGCGLTLYHSPPPVKGRLGLVRKPQC
jgi:hypothetical protein